MFRTRKRGLQYKSQSYFVLILSSIVNLQWYNCKFTVLPDPLIVNLQCAVPQHCTFTVGTSCEIDAKAMAFTVGIQWFYSGHTVYLQCAHCKIIQWRELLSSLPL